MKPNKKDESGEVPICLFLDNTDQRFAKKLEVMKQLNQFNSFVTREYLLQDDDPFLLWRNHLSPIILKDGSGEDVAS